MKKKLVSIILTLAMALSMLPLSALAASWTATLGGSQITLTENEDGSITADGDNAQYYTFSKVADGDADTFKYYEIATGVEGTVTGTPVTVEEECTCETKCDPASPNAGCPICSAEGADIETDCLGTASEVDGDTVTAEAEVGSDGKAEANVTVTEQEAAGMVEAAVDGVLKVEVTTEQAEEVTVNLPEELVGAATAKNAITTVKVTTEIATVDLPVSALTEATASLTVSKVGATTTVLGGVSLSLDSASEFETPVAVTIKVEVSIKNPVVAYMDAGRFFRVRQNPADRGAFTFFTRHFSDFVVVDGDAAALESVEMEDIGSGRNHVYAIEADEALVAAVKASDGSLNYVSVGPVADEMMDKTVNARVNAPDAEIDNVCAIVGEMKLNADGSVADDAFENAMRVDSSFGEIL